MRPCSVTNKPTLLPLFLQTCSKVGEERDEFSPLRRNKPLKGSMSQFFFIFFFFILIIYYRYIQSIYIMYILCTHLLISGLVGGSAEQPPLGPNGKALNQSKPHPSNRIV